MPQGGKCRLEGIRSFGLKAMKLRRFKVEECNTVKLALVLFFVVVWLYFSSVFQTFGIGFGIGSLAFEQCSLRDEKLQVMKNNILDAILYEEGLKQMRNVTASLDKLHRQLDAVRAQDPTLYVGFEDGNAYVAVCEARIASARDAQQETARQNAARVEAANRQASCTETVRGVDAEILNAKAPFKRSNFNRDWGNVGNAIFNAMFKNYGPESYVNKERLFIPDREVPCKEDPLVLEEIEDISFLKNLVQVSLKAFATKGAK